MSFLNHASHRENLVELGTKLQHHIASQPVEGPFDLLLGEGPSGIFRR
jgi:hypothetical protein